jgi:TonB family protein
MRLRLVLGLLCALLVAQNAQAQARDTVERTYFEFQVEKAVRHAPGSAAPRYPPALKAAGVEGEVLVQFVVDTLGAADVRSFKVLKASHGDFIESVKAALPNMKFVPAELRGRKVRQLVQQPFVFAIQKKDSTGAVSVPASRAPLPPPPPAAVTPAPRGGTVRGWTIVRRITADSGDGSEGFSTVQRQFGTVGHLRTEMEPPSRFPQAKIVSLLDVATGRRTTLQESTKTATVMSPPRPSPLGFSSVFRPSENGIVDLGAGDAIAGLPTRHYRVTGTTTTRYELGDRVCTVSRETVTEYWTTKDSAFTAIQRHLSGVGSATALGAATTPVVDTGGLARLGPVLRFISHNAVPVARGARPVKSTIEVLGFSEGDLEASLFEPPEGYQLRDFSSSLPSARSDSLRFIAAKRMFEQTVDTTQVVPGVTTSCTPSKAP